MTIKAYVVMKNGSNKVDNIILADENHRMEGYTLTELKREVYCNPGMYLNPADGLYYQDTTYKTIYPAYKYIPGTTTVEKDT